MRPLDEHTLEQLTANWRALAARADQFFEQILASHSASMRCGPGCDACCQQDLALLPLEALALLAGLDQLSPEQRRPLQRAARAGAPPCPLLAPESGRCNLYESRPIICRTHGLPVLYREHSEGAEEGAAELSVCHLNFTEGDVPGDAVLDGGVLTAALSVADRLVRQELGLPPGEDRIQLSTLVAGGWESFPASAARDTF